MISRAQDPCRLAHSRRMKSAGSIWVAATVTLASNVTSRLCIAALPYNAINYHRPTDIRRVLQYEVAGRNSEPELNVRTRCELDDS